MMRPRRAFIMPRSTPFASANAGFRLVAMIASQSSSFIRTSRLSRVMPALLTRIAMAPCRDSMSRSTASTAAASRTSRRKPSPLTPAVAQAAGDRRGAFVGGRRADHVGARAARARARSHVRCPASRPSRARPGPRARVARSSDRPASCRQVRDHAAPARRALRRVLRRRSARSRSAPDRCAASGRRAPCPGRIRRRA